MNFASSTSSPVGTTTTITALNSSSNSKSKNKRRSFSSAAAQMFPSSLNDRTFEIFDKSSTINRRDNQREKGGECAINESKNNNSHTKPRRERRKRSEANTPGTNLLQNNNSYSRAKSNPSKTKNIRIRKEEAWNLLTGLNNKQKTTSPREDKELQLRQEQQRARRREETHHTLPSKGSPKRNISKTTSTGKNNSQNQKHKQKQYPMQQQKNQTKRPRNKALDETKESISNNPCSQGKRNSRQPRQQTVLPIDKYTSNTLKNNLKNENKIDNVENEKGKARKQRNKNKIFHNNENENTSPIFINNNNVVTSENNNSNGEFKEIKSTTPTTKRTRSSGRRRRVQRASSSTKTENKTDFLKKITESKMQDTKEEKQQQQEQQEQPPEEHKEQQPEEEENKHTEEKELNDNINDFNSFRDAKERPQSSIESKLQEGKSNGDRRRRPRQQKSKSSEKRRQQKAVSSVSAGSKNEDPLESSQPPRPPGGRPPRTGRTGRLSAGRFRVADKHLSSSPSEFVRPPRRSRAQQLREETRESNGGSNGSSSSSSNSIISNSNNSTTSTTSTTSTSSLSSSLPSSLTSTSSPSASSASSQKRRRDRGGRSPLAPLNTNIPRMRELSSTPSFIAKEQHIEHVSSTEQQQQQQQQEEITSPSTTTSKKIVQDINLDDSIPKLPGRSPFYSHTRVVMGLVEKRNLSPTKVIGSLLQSPSSNKTIAVNINKNNSIHQEGKHQDTSLTNKDVVEDVVFVAGKVRPRPTVAVQFHQRGLPKGMLRLVEVEIPIISKPVNVSTKRFVQERTEILVRRLSDEAPGFSSIAPYQLRKVLQKLLIASIQTSPTSVIESALMK